MDKICPQCLMASIPDDPYIYVCDECQKFNNDEYEKLVWEDDENWPRVKY